MAWAKNGTPETKSSSGDTDDNISDLTAYKFNQSMEHFFINTGMIVGVRFDADSGSVYAVRNSRNGGTDATAGSQAQINDDVTSLSGTEDRFHITYMCNISGEETLMISFGVGHGTAGATNDPDRVEAVGKDAGTTQFIQMGRYRFSGSGDFDTNSNNSILGTD